MKLIANKFKTDKLDFRMNPADVIMAQYDYDFEKAGKTSVSELYMPQDEQDKMAEWMKINLVCFKRMPTVMIDRELSWIILDIFPRVLE